MAALVMFDHCLLFVKVEVAVYEILRIRSIQCFDTVGWGAGRVSGVKN